MNAALPLSHAQPCPPCSLPAELEALAPPPLLLPGESLQRYQLMRRPILIELAPRSVIEWLLAIDVVELCWEIQRYRLIRQKLVESHRQRAIEHCLRRIDLAGIPVDLKEQACEQIKRNAVIWRIDRHAANEIEARLLAYGIDQDSINAEAYQQAREAFLAFEALIASAHNRRLSLLRELDRQRYCCPA
jgi:hypothetical protein